VVCAGQKALTSTHSPLGHLKDLAGSVQPRRLALSAHDSRLATHPPSAHLTLRVKGHWTSVGQSRMLPLQLASGHVTENVSQGFGDGCPLASTQRARSNTQLLLAHKTGALSGHEMPVGHWLVELATHAPLGHLDVSAGHTTGGRQVSIASLQEPSEHWMNPSAQLGFEGHKKALSTQAPLLQRIWRHGLGATQVSTLSTQVPSAHMTFPKGHVGPTGHCEPNGMQLPSGQRSAFTPMASTHGYCVGHSDADDWQLRSRAGK
jgi:hypothetical protein